MRLAPKFLWFLLLAPALFGFDFATKAAVVENIRGGQEIELVTGWLSLVHHENPGAAFSLQLPTGVLIAFALLALGLMAQLLWALPARAKVPAIALALVASGALGNLVDRIADGTVTDFVRVYTVHPSLAPWLVEQFGTATWPIFNVADVTILAGALLYIAAMGYGGEEDVADEPAEVAAS